MNEYPPQNPIGDVVVPVPPTEPLAVTGAEGIYWLLLIASILIFLGIWAIVHVGKQSDKHHENDII